MATAVEHTYHYSRASEIRHGGPGGPVALLATSGGLGPGGALAAPRFFDGFLGNAEQIAIALRMCGRVARTRFYVPPGMLAAVLRAADPVVTSNGDRLRFESFSACCGVYARLDVLPAGLDGAVMGSGTTNVDFNPPMREALARVGGLDPLHVSVGLDDVTVSTMEGTVVEKKVPLPERWLKGFAEVQQACAGMAPLAELGGPAAKAFLRGLPKSWRGPGWAVPSGRTLRISPRPGRGAACASGPDRLRVLEPLARFATGLRVYGAADPGGLPVASAWELVCRDTRFVVVLSPEVARGFSGEGAVLGDLAADQGEEDADLVAALLAWEPRVDPDRLACESALPAARVTRALGRLGAAGRVGYDLAEGGYFHRELPYDPAALAAMHPRLRDARALAESGAVTVTPTGARVASGGTEHHVTRTGGGTRCTCPWWGKHRGGRGPCKHVLAAELVSRR
ncbi:SWIM zinc finger family protein [Spirillospora sp. NPDC047279]|uniref:SWIM zinc finger family protein n=1 Tax=Spirillospora sp. NPDC047279 TaxID=3155478 RepID=UPI00340D7CF1